MRLKTPNESYRAALEAARLYVKRVENIRCALDDYERSIGKPCPEQRLLVENLYARSMALLIEYKLTQAS